MWDQLSTETVLWILEQCLFKQEVDRLADKILSSSSVNVMVANRVHTLDVCLSIFVIIFCILCIC